MRKPGLLVCTIAAMIALGGCSEQERREAREQQERIAAEAAHQQRLAAQYAAELSEETRRRNNVLAAETQRIQDALDAETERRFDQHMSMLGRFALVVAGVGGVIGWIVYSIRRLGEKHTEERTKRHEHILKAILADSNVSPDHRRELYGRAIEAANKGGTPLIGYSSNEGGAS